MPASVELPEILDAHLSAQNENTHQCLPCKVVSYDATTQTVAAQVLVKRPGRDADGEPKYEALPIYPSVPVAFPRAGGFVVYLPIAAGSYGHLIFCDMSTGEAVATGQVSEPKDMGRHTGGYAIFLPAQAVAPQALADTPGNGYIGLDGNVAQAHFTAGTIKLGKTATDYVALSTLVNAQLTALKNVLAAWVPVPTDGGAALKTALTTLIATGWPASTSATVVKAQ